MSRTVAIVGRPNVGKSALFNRLAGRKIAIVHDQPGVTRDRIRAECRLGSAPFAIFDTGGIGADVDASFKEQVQTEADIAIATSDVLLLVVDGQDGLTAVERALALRPRVALVDIGLPGIDGHEVARRLRARLGGNVFLVALTGYGQPEDKSRALEAGFDVHMTKPPDVAALKALFAGVGQAG